MSSEEEALVWSKQDTTWMTENIDPFHLASISPSDNLVFNIAALPSSHYIQASNQYVPDDFTTYDDFYTDHSLTDIEQQLYTPLQNPDTIRQATWTFSTDDQGRIDSTDLTSSLSASPFDFVQLHPQCVELQPTTTGHHTQAIRRQDPRHYPEYTHHITNIPPENKPVPAQRRRGRPRIYSPVESFKLPVSNQSVLHNDAAAATHHHHASTVTQNAIDAHLHAPHTHPDTNAPMPNLAAGSQTHPQPSHTTPRRPRGRPPIYPRPSHLPSPQDQPPSSIDLTRESNRLAAQRFRVRQDTYVSNLTSQADDLESKNTELKKEVRELRERVIALKYGVLRHGEETGCKGVLEGVVGLASGGRSSAVEAEVSEGTSEGDGAGGGGSVDEDSGAEIVGE